MQVDERAAVTTEWAEVAAAAAGDSGAFEALYRRHAPRVYGLCLRMTGNVATAEDCVQDAFVAAWRALPGFERRSGFGTWLHRIAVNAVLARRRGAAARLESTVGDAEVLVALHGHSHEEAADCLGIAVGTCKAQLHRARRLLEQRLGLGEQTT